MRELVFGSQSTPVPPQLRFFVQFLASVASEVRPRIVKIPVLSDKELSGLKMPMLVILGGKDVLLDTAEAKRRVERFVPQANVRYLPKARHVIPGQAGTILEFLLRAAAREGRDSGQPTVLNCG
jgi:pimeloyl-ACP methyl ester carboxylesterase